MKCKNYTCDYHDVQMTDNCSKGEPPNVGSCPHRSYGKDNGGDKFHYHEIVDRCHIICSMIDDLLIDHPGMEKMTNEWCELAQRSLVSVKNRASELGDNLVI